MIKILKCYLIRKIKRFFEWIDSNKLYERYDIKGV